MNWTMTADKLSLCLCDDGEVMDALSCVVAGLRGAPHHVQADRAALALYFACAPEMTLADWKRRWSRVRAAARKVLDTDNFGHRAGVLAPAVIRQAAGI